MTPTHPPDQHLSDSPGRGPESSGARPPEPAPAPARAWTSDQLEAIELRGANVVVSAAAGSGKTAVLTERVLRLVTSRENPAPLEDLLVVTFTRKAAREMRERIEARLMRALADSPDDESVRQAIDALPRAAILTIDAFCERLVRREFHRAGVSPGVRPADEDERLEIVRRSARDVFESFASARDDDPRADAFALLLGTVSSSDPLGELSGRVTRVRDFLARIEEPDRWLARTRESLGSLARDGRPERTGWFDFVIATMREDALRLQAALRAVGHAVERGAGSGALDREPVASLLSLSDSIDEILDLDDPRDPRGTFERFRILTDDERFARLEKLGNKGVSGGLLESPRMKAALRELSKAGPRFRERWFSIPRDREAEALRLVAREGLALLDLAEATEARMREHFARRGVLGFAEIERLALRVLVEPDGSPSPVALECRRRFRHVLVDEFQDVSPLQDAIVRAVSRHDDPESPNLFVVGDVKQSVYRFRGAEPNLFVRRMLECGEPAGPTEPRRVRVDLRSNFRSRAGILEFANAVFGRLMDRALGDVAYDASARLRPGRDDVRDEEGVEEATGAVRVEAHWLARGSTGDEEGDDARPGETPGADDLADAERQAEWVARRILELTDPARGLSIPDETRGAGGSAASAFRRARPGDVAILMRGVRGEVAVWRKAFERFHLQLAVAESADLLESQEVADVLAALRLADHPLQDEALATAMRSPLGGFTDEDLLRIRMVEREGPFHRAAWIAAGRGAAPGAGAAAGAGAGAAPSIDDMDGLDRMDGMDDPDPGDLGDDSSSSSIQSIQSIQSVSPSAHTSTLPEPLVDRLARFFGLLDRWRGVARTLGPEETFDAILASTDYAAHVAGRPDAPRRLHDLDRLRRQLRAHAERETGEAGLSGFLRRLDEIRSERAPSDDAEEAPDDPDAVRLLTIHKSKGLEFPIVFVPRLERPFKKSPQTVGLHPEHGLAHLAIDPGRRLRLSPAPCRAVEAADALHERAEEIRLLYVALTRARERLVLVGSPKGPGKDPRPQWLASPIAPETGPLAPRGATVLDAAPVLTRLLGSSPLDLLGPIVASLEADGAPWLEVRTLDGRPKAPERHAMPQALDALLASADVASPRMEAAREEARSLWPDRASDLPRPPEDIARSPRLIVPSPDALAASRAPSRIVASGLRRDPERRVEVWGSDEVEAGEVRFLEDEPDDPAFAVGPPPPLRRVVGLATQAPAFIRMETRREALAAAESSGARPSFDPAELGTAAHRLLARLDLAGPLDRASLKRRAREMFDAGELSLEDERRLAFLPYMGIETFFQSPLGRRMVAHRGTLERELPVRFGKLASDLHRREPDGALRPVVPPDTPGAGDDRILLQGVVDAVWREPGEGSGAERVVILDWKTDRVANEEDFEALADRYRAQLEAYRQAIRAAWRRPVGEVWIAALSAGRNLRIDDGT